jgi:sugar phosphate isomerase/epimerase
MGAPGNRTNAMNPLALNFYICNETVGLEDFVRMSANAGVTAVGLTVRAVTQMEVSNIRRLLAAYGLKVSSLNSVGYFLYGDKARSAAQEDLNTRLIAAAGELAAETLVVIAGGLNHGPGGVAGARAAVEDGIAKLAQRAARDGITLGLEPIHPLGVLEKGCINTIRQAALLASKHDNVGLTIDFFHSWWDPDFFSVFSENLRLVRLVQICNVVAPDDHERFHRDELQNGLIDVRHALRHIARSGYRGYFEFEMFPEHLRGRSVDRVIAAVRKQYAKMTQEAAA